MVISSKNQKLKEYQQLGIELFILEVPVNIRQLIGFFKKNVLRDLVPFLFDCNTVYFYMPHPMDNWIARALIRQKINVIRSIHDCRRHPGDWWPTKVSIKRQIRYSSEIVAHSEFVAQRVGSSIRPIVLPLPVPKRRIKRRNITKTVLFIGRFRAYKGIDLLLEAWPKVLRVIPEAKLVLAGDGNLKKFGELTNVTIVNRWLESGEIERLIDSSSCVVFPYIEASQSGPLSLAISAHRPVVITNVGGLMEQAAKGCYFEANFSSDSIAAAILEAIASSFEYRNETIENRELADYLIEKSKH